MLLLPGLCCTLRLPPFMFWQLCVALLDAAGEGVAAVLTDPALTAVVVADPDDDDVDVVCAVAALAAARLPPNPTPSAPAPIALARIILPILVFNVSAS